MKAIAAGQTSLQTSLDCDIATANQPGTEEHKSVESKEERIPPKRVLFASHSWVSLTKLLSSISRCCQITTAMSALSSESELGAITKLPPAKEPFDIDYTDNKRHYVRLEDSEELRQFFADVRSICLAKISKDPELYYPLDVHKLQHQEWMIRRFMTHHKGDRMHLEDAQKTSDTIIKMMQWKRKMNLWGESWVIVCAFQDI